MLFEIRERPKNNMIFELAGSDVTSSAATQESKFDEQFYDKCIALLFYNFLGLTQ